MATLEELRQKVESTEQMQSVVKTMKTIAAVSIRQYEKAVESLSDFNNTIKMGLKILLQHGPLKTRLPGGEKQGKKSVVVFGSDQGMCGQFNEQIASFTLETLEKEAGEKEDIIVLAVGERVVPSLEEGGLEIRETFSVPSSIAGITPTVQDIVLKIEQLQLREHLTRVDLFHNRPLSGSSYQPRTLRLLPLDRKWLESLRQEKWPSNNIPISTLAWENLFSGLVRYNIFVSLYRYMAESLSAENASRIASMQNAERNIEEQLEELKARFRHERQQSITEELLDIVSGFEALS